MKTFFLNIFLRNQYTKIDAIFLLTIMTSELLKYLYEQLVNLKCETTKMMLAKNIKNGFLRKNVFV